MNIHCDKKPALCREDSNPLTQEPPDGGLFISRVRSFVFFEPPPNRPEIVDLPVDCVDESQDDADACAQNQAIIVTQLPSFTNEPQSCTRFCQDGSPFTYFVSGGRFLSWSQQEANNMAFQFACAQAWRHLICFGPLRIHPCLNALYDEIITVNSYFPIMSMEMIEGELPDGLEFELKDGNIRIHGTPTEDGEFEFTFRGENNFGDFFQKPYTMVVGESALFAWEGRFTGELLDLSAPDPFIAPPLIQFPPLGIESIESSFGSCSGTVSAKATSELHSDAQGIWLMKGHRLPGMLGKNFNVRIFGTAKNGHAYIIRVDTSWPPGFNFTRIRTQFVGDATINESQNFTVGAAPNFELWWGVKIKPGETTEAEIKLNYVITEIP
jgi:hypothetical protein